MNKVKKIINKKILFTIVGVLFIVTLFFLLKGKDKETVYIEDYSYINIEKSDNAGQITLNGRVAANNPIGIFVDKKLKVTDVPVKNGDYVEKGEVLVTFDDDEKNKILRNINKERINKAKQERDLKVTKELHKIGGASLNEIKDLEGNLKITILNIEELQELLSKTAKEVISPVRGVVSKVKAQKNYLVDTDAPLMEIIDSDDLKIIIEIPEYDSNSVKLGQDVIIKFEVLDDKIMYEGKITKISKISTKSNLTGENVIEAEVKPNLNIPNLIPGFKVKANINLKSNIQNIVIPKIALLFDGKNYYIYKLDKENFVRKVYIKIKNISGNDTIVTEGLNTGDIIITTPDPKLKEGLKLEEGNGKVDNKV